MKSYLRNFILFLITALLISSCKKKDKKEVIPEEEPQPQTEVIPTYIDGRLELYQEYYIIEGVLSLRNKWASGLFYASLKNKDSLAYNDLRDVGNVSLNQIKLDKGSDNSYGLYSEDDSDLLTAPCNWNITGNSNYEAFNYSDISKINYKGGKNLPDSLFLRSDTTKIEISDYNGADRVEVSILANDRSISSATKTLYPPLKTANFDRKDLQNVVIEGGYFVTIKVTFYRNVYAKVGTKILNFATTLTIRKRDVSSGIY